MTVGSPLRAIIKFAIPLILGYILQQMYLIIDAAIVGRWIGVGALAAVGASSSIMFLIMGFCNGSCAGFAIPIAQAFGAKDYAKMRAYVSNSIRIAVVFAVVITFLSCIFCLCLEIWRSSVGGNLRTGYSAAEVHALQHEGYPSGGANYRMVLSDGEDLPS